jgi:predicted Zn-dependent peptidase
VTRSTVAGGIRLLTSEDHGPSLVTVAVYLEGSVRHENEKNNGITRLLRETLLTTTDPRSEGRSYRFSLLDLGRLAPYQDRDMWGFSMTVPADRWKDALERLGTMLAHPEIDTVAVDATRLLVLDEQARWLQNDAARRDHLIFETKYEVSGYGLPLLGSRSSIVHLSLPDVQRFYETFVVKPNLVVAVFGDVNASEVGPAVTAAFRDVRDGPYEPGEVVREGPFEGFREKWELGQGKECTVTVAFDGPPGSSSDVPVLYVINSLFANPRGWLKTYVRDKNAAVVAAESYVAHMIDESPIVTTITVDGPLAEEEAVKMLFGQFRSTAGIRLVGEFDKDYDNARHHAAWTFQMNLATNAGRAFQHARAEIFRLPADHVAAFPARLLAVTPDDIQAAAFRYFQYPDAGKRPYAVCETRPGGW